jgi:hypothetical protein
LLVLFAMALIGAAPAAKAQEASPPLDGRERVVHDTLLDHLATFDPVTHAWSTLMRSKNQKGDWVTFATERFTK